MKWPLRKQAVADEKIPFFNRTYLHSIDREESDPTMVWTTEVNWQAIQNFVREQSKKCGRVVTAAHLLVKAVGVTLREHPRMNQRIVGRRIYGFEDCNVCLASRQSASDEINVILIHQADQKELPAIAEHIWQAQLALNRGTAPEQRDRERLKKLPRWLFGSIMRTFQRLDRWRPLPVMGRLDRLRCSPVLVNDFSHRNAPLLRSYKPSRFPDQSKPLNVVLGPREVKVVWKDNQAQPELVAPLIVRADHRICDGYEFSRFVGALANLLNHPEQLDVHASPSRPSCQIRGVEPWSKSA